MWYSVLFPCIKWAFSCLFYDMVTAARCPRTGIVPHSPAEVKRAFCSVSWQTGGASLRSAERVEQQSSKQGAAEDSCPFVFACAVPLHYAVFTCVMQHCSYGASHSCNPFPLGEPRILLSAKWYGVLICRQQFMRLRCHYIGVSRAGSTIPPRREEDTQCE